MRDNIKLLKDISRKIYCISGVNKLTIKAKEIWKVNINEKVKWILVLYNISFNHFVGVPIYDFEKDDRVYIPSINKFASPNEINEYTPNVVEKRMILKGEIAQINNYELRKVISFTKQSLLEFIRKNTKNDFEGLSYVKWCKDKLNLIHLDNQDLKKEHYHNYDICWIDFGYNIGNELRKLRPAILWRYSSSKEMWTVLPLTSKRDNDKYFYHYDLENKKIGTVKIENMANISVKRIKMPYYIQNKVAKISNNDYKEIIKILKRYYLNSKENELNCFSSKTLAAF